MPGTDQLTRCATDGCTAILSRFNEGDHCSIHEADAAWAKEIETYKLDRPERTLRRRLEKRVSSAERADAHAFLEALRG